MSYDRILDVAFELFSRDDYDNTSMLQIATELGLKEPSIYCFFSNKEDVFMTMINREVESFLLYLEEVALRIREHHIRDELFSLLKEIIDYWIKVKENKGLCWTKQMILPLNFYRDQILLAKEPINKKLYEIEFHIFKKAIEEGKIKGQKIEDIIYSYSSLMKGNLTMILLDQQFTNDNLESSFEVFWSGIEK